MTGPAGPGAGAGGAAAPLPARALAAERAGVKTDPGPGRAFMSHDPARSASASSPMSLLYVARCTARLRLASAASLAAACRPTGQTTALSR